MLNVTNVHKEKCHRCVLSSPALTVTFCLLSHFSTRGNHHASDLKLAGAAAISQTLSLGSPLPLAPSVTFTLQLNWSIRAE